MNGVACRCVLLAAVILFAGCSRSINSDYAAVRGDSVNGVSVFIDYLKSQGHRVGSARDFKPGMDYSADVLVHFSDGNLPYQDVLDWLEIWLEEPDVHVVWVFRGYDAEIDYWNDALKLHGDDYTAKQQESIRQQLSDAQFRESFYANKVTRPHVEGWFDYKVTPAETKEVHTVEVAEDWERYFDDLSGFRIRTRQKMEIPEDAEPMVWTEDGDVLVSRQAVGQGYFWAVSNASFLVNYGLIPHQHRRLAAALTDSLGEERRIVFVRRAELGEDVPPQAATLWRFLTISPINWIAGHLFVALLAYILYRFAIFGRPKEVRRRESYRFGKHVEALGKMLQSTGDVDFARSRLAAYKRHRSPTREEHSKNPEPR